MNSVFRFNEPHYSLRNTDTLVSRNVKTVLYGTESISTLAPKIWNLVPVDIKNSKSAQQFKENIRSWRTDSCPCRLCKKYIPKIGFL